MTENFGRAIEYFTKAIQVFHQERQANSMPSPSVLSESHRGRGECYLKTGKHAEAVNDLTEAMRAFPDEGPFWLSRTFRLRGQALLRMGDYEKALSDLSEAVRVDPQLDDAWQYRADCHLALGACDRAIEDYSEAIRRHLAGRTAGGLTLKLPSHQRQRYHVNRGLAYLKSGDTKKAVEDFDTAASFGTSGLPEVTALACFNRAWTHLKNGDGGRAVEDFTTAIRLTPTFVAAYEGRAAAHRAVGDSAAADADESKARAVATTPARQPISAGTNSAVEWGKVGTAVVKGAGAVAGLVFLASAAVAGLGLVAGAVVMGVDMAGSMQCRHCGERRNPEYDVCPHCGLSSK